MYVHQNTTKYEYILSTQTPNLYLNTLHKFTTVGVFDWASSVTYVLTDWTFLTILYSTGTGNEAK